VVFKFIDVDHRCLKVQKSLLGKR